MRGLFLLERFQRWPVHLAAAGILSCIPAGGQSLMNGGGEPVRLFGTDMAVLELKEARKDLPCTVNAAGKAQMGFDLKFHSGYEVTIPLRELAGRENILTILFRVTPEQTPENPVYLTQKVRVPEIEEEAKGDASIYGSFDLGEGKYKVDWLLRDRSERVCSSYWDVEAELGNKDSQISLVLPPRTVRETEPEQFQQEPPVERELQDDPLVMKVLLNYAPQNPRSAIMRPIDTTALISILRSISREPRIAKFSLVVFSMASQNVLYRQENADRLDFEALGEAVSKLKLGTVEVSKLAVKHSDTQFLSELLRKELSDTERTDAIIIAGPKVMLDHNVETETLKDIGTVEAPVFYMNYNLYPTQIPWRDSISHAVRFFKGQEFTISKPRDLWFATTEVVNRVVKGRTPRVSRNSPSQ